MGQRHMAYNGSMVDMEMDQHVHLQPEPACLPHGSVTSFLQPNSHARLPSTGNISTFNSHHQPESHSSLPHGMSQYNGIEHLHPSCNMDMVAAASSNHLNTYMTPPSRVFPASLNHGLDQLPFPNNHGSFGVSADNYGRNSHVMEGVGGPFKRKNAEGIPGTFQYFYPSVGSSSTVAVPMPSRSFETDVPMMDPASFAISEYQSNELPPFLEAVPLRSMGNRSGAVGVDPVLPPNNSHLIPGSYIGQPIHTVVNPWLDQQFRSNGVDTGSYPWNHAPGLPYLQGCINGNGSEAANMGVQGYHSLSNINSNTYVQPPISQQVHHNFHHPPPPPAPLQPLRGHSVDFHSRRLPADNISYNAVNPFQNVTDPGPRFVGPAPPTGLRIYRSHRRETMFDPPARHRGLPHLRVLPEDGVAILDTSEYHEVGHSVDHHRDMRLDIDHMSYEELLALGEQIGSVGSGLSDDLIVSRLKVKTFVSSPSSHPKDDACEDQELNFCVICQTNFNDQDMIGILNCCHEYHVDCIKKWLVVKNSCPICKSCALTSERTEP